MRFKALLCMYTVTNSYGISSSIDSFDIDQNISNTKKTVIKYQKVE